MSMFYSNPKLSAARTARRDALTQRSPALAKLMKPFWDAADAKYGQKADAGAPQPDSTTTMIYGPGPLGATPQVGGRNTKTLLGM